MFGIAFTSSAINFLDTLERRQDPKYASLQQHFGSLDVSILTLYMSMTGGQNWGVFYEALITVPGGEFTCILFIVYITFAAWHRMCRLTPYPPKAEGWPWLALTFQGPLRCD